MLLDGPILLMKKRREGEVRGDAFGEKIESVDASWAVGIVLSYSGR